MSEGNSNESRKERKEAHSRGKDRDKAQSSTIILSPSDNHKSENILTLFSLPHQTLP